MVMGENRMSLDVAGHSRVDRSYSVCFTVSHEVMTPLPCPSSRGTVSFSHSPELLFTRRVVRVALIIDGMKSSWMETLTWTRRGGRTMSLFMISEVGYLGTEHRDYWSSKLQRVCGRRLVKYAAVDTCRQSCIPTHPINLHV